MGGSCFAILGDEMLVRARGEQLANDLNAAVIARPDQRCITGVAYCVHFGAAGEKLAHDAEAPSLAGPEERCPAAFVSRLDVRAPVAQLAHARKTTTAHRYAQP